VSKLLENLGEAANRVSRETRSRYPDVPWREVIDLRSFLIHGYDLVDYRLVSIVIYEDLPGLVDELERAIDDYDQRSS
jgi:uncharacterized protein with HEPN domain